jgi:hypothetical protein
MSWKDTVAKAYTTVPKSVKEAIWKIGVGVTVISSVLTGFAIWKNPTLVFGVPVPRQSIVERLAHNGNIKKLVYELMREYFFSHRPHGLMFVSWEEVDEMVGLWVRPANRFPGKAGPHSLTPDMRVLGGPFLFGECAQTESLAMPGRVMVACPIINEYDVWGYVAAIVDDTPEVRTLTERLVRQLAHRVTGLIY